MRLEVEPPSMEMLVPVMYEARAETEVIGYRVAYEDFAVILEMHPQVGLELLKSLAKSLLDSD